MIFLHFLHLYQSHERGSVTSRGSRGDSSHLLDCPSISDPEVNLRSTTSSIHWQDKKNLRLCASCPIALHSWLKDSGSLTARLLELSQRDFRVEVLFQGLAITRLDERRLLNLKSTDAVLVREVILHGKNQPWVFARSLLPLSSLTGQLRQLRKASRKPLGAFLFKQPKLKRSPMLVAEFKPSTAIIPTQYHQNKSLWGRSSVFYVDQKPLLVSEVFLPDFIQRLTDQA
jgi:chorismate lyase